MSIDLVNPPSHIPPSLATRMSQQAPRILQTSSFKLPYGIIIPNDTQESWITYENLFLSCLRTGDDGAAKACLDRLVERFGDDNEKVMALQAMYAEAKAEDSKALEEILKEYDGLLQEQPTNMPVRKRRIALLRSMSKPSEATAALVDLLDASPTDAESWAELSDLYLIQGLFSQAVYSLEEVLLLAPNAWNIQARMGEILYLWATAVSNNNEGSPLRRLAEAMRRFCRSIELCDNYLRGYYGLKLTSKRILELASQDSRASEELSDSTFGDIAPLSVPTVQKLHELSTTKLSEIVRKSSSGDPDLSGFDEAEVVAARELLDRDVKDKER